MVIVNCMFLLLSSDLIFLPKIILQNADLWQNLAQKSSQSASDVSYDLFLLSKVILTCIKVSTTVTDTQISVHPTITNMAAPWSAKV